MSEYHQPVLLTQSVDGLAIVPDGVYADMTFGGGGHSREILNRLGPDGKLFGFDQDEDTLNNVPSDERFTFVRSNFQYLKRFMRYYNIDGVDGILADLGVSSHHFDEAERGFSFRFDADLDMRMNQKGEKSASEVLNEFLEEDLFRIFKMYGEIKNAGKLVREIVSERNASKITTTTRLREIASRCTPAKTENQYLAKVFQALRLEVNDEIKVLKNMLEAALAVLKPGGRLSVISYHSLEDRLVKNFMKSGNFEGKQEKDFFGNVNTPFKLVTRKVVIPDDKEIAENPRARSAKLRIAEKL